MFEDSFTYLCVFVLHLEVYDLHQYMQKHHAPWITNRRQSITYVHTEVAILCDIINKAVQFIITFLEFLHLMEEERKPPGANEWLKKSPWCQLEQWFCKLQRLPSICCVNFWSLSYFSHQWVLQQANKIQVNWKLLLIQIKMFLCCI